jgi:hypothetical protein
VLPPVLRKASAKGAKQMMGGAKQAQKTRKTNDGRAEQAQKTRKTNDGRAKQMASHLRGLSGKDRTTPGEDSWASSGNGCSTAD